MYTLPRDDQITLVVQPCLSLSYSFVRGGSSSPMNLQYEMLKFSQDGENPIYT